RNARPQVLPSALPTRRNVRRNAAVSPRCATTTRSSPTRSWRSPYSAPCSATTSLSSVSTAASKLRCVCRRWDICSSMTLPTRTQPPGFSENKLAEIWFGRGNATARVPSCMPLFGQQEPPHQPPRLLGTLQHGGVLGALDPGELGRRDGGGEPARGV